MKNVFLSEHQMSLFSLATFLTSTVSVDAVKNRKERLRRSDGEEEPQAAAFTTCQRWFPSLPLDPEWGLTHLFQTWKVWQEVGDSCILCPKQHPTSSQPPSVHPTLLSLTWRALVALTMWFTFFILPCTVPVRSLDKSFQKIRCQMKA